MGTCYRSDPESTSVRRRREFDPQRFDAWLERLSTRGLCPILIGLSLKLERLALAPLDGARRLEIVRRLSTLVRDVADDLPRARHSGGRPQGGVGQPLTLEQRLICLAFKNLKRTLESLDRAGGAVEHREEARRWVLQELFVWLGRQIELGALWGQPWPPQTWQELHDLHAYCCSRGAGDCEALDSFDFEASYRRLLLLGLIADRRATALLEPYPADRLAAWSRESSLNDPASYFGVAGVYLVQPSRDAPPRRVDGALGAVPRAWVLDVPTDLRAGLEDARTEAEPTEAAAV